MANLSLAVPQYSWLRVLSEVQRILAAGGRLELIDDQILFPYDESHPRTSLLTPQPSSSRNPASSFDLDSEDEATGTNTVSMLVDEPTDLEPPPQTLQEQPSPEAISNGWETHTENSKGLETIFESMLLKKYGISPRPQDIMDVVLNHVFGHKHTNQIKSIHLALAPADHTEPDCIADEMSTICPEVQLINRQSGDGSIDTGEAQLQTMDDHHTTPIGPQRPTRRSSFNHDTISPKAADLLGIGISDRTSGENNRHSQFPEPISMRTVGRVKLYQSIKWKGKWRESVRSRRASMESLRSEIPESISPKAAERLGIAPTNRSSWGSQRSLGSQSSQMMRADHLSGDGVCRESNILDTHSVKAADCVGISSSLSTTQSPGLILWPSTFIPVEPLELEMHACKHMHVLLGCKGALSDFIQDIKNADGQAHISQEEFNDLTWEYEW